MNKLKKNMWFMICVFVLMFVSLIGYTSFIIATNGSKWFASPYNTARIQRQRERVTPGDIYDANGLLMVTSDEKGNRVYPQSEVARFANAHVLGDPYGITSGGAEAKYNKYLYGFNLNMIDRTIQAFKAEKNKGNDIHLTIDSDLNKFMYEAMGNNQGAAVVMNYKTGEIVGSVSKDSFDPSTIKELMKKPLPEGDSRLLNKPNAGLYPPGSTFKMVTTASAFENIPDAENLKLDSPSSIKVNGEPITNYDKKQHGTIDLKKAVEVSSNTYFAQISKKIGADSLTKTANNFGFNDDFAFSDITLYQSSFSAGTSDNDLAWASVGQYKDLATPMHMCMVTSSIANDGAMMEPKLLKDMKNSLNMSIHFFRSNKYKQSVTPETSRKTKALLINAVENGTGKAAKVSGAKIGGKTGSAETDKGTHAWFTGFIDDPDHPYAVVVILENAGTGGSKAAPVAGKIFDRLLKK